MMGPENVIFRRTTLVLGLVAAMGAAGCDDPFEDRERDNFEGAATLYSLSRAEWLGYPAGLVLLARAPGPVVVESANSNGWDLALSEDEGGFILVPAGAFNTQSASGIRTYTGRSWEDVTEAPEDGDTFNDSTAVPLNSNAVYVVRSRSSGSCIYFSKVRATEVDETEGTVRFEYLMNPNCNARDLQPPPPEDES